MAKTINRIFLDTSVLFSAIYSAEGGARELTRLSELGVIRLLISTDVLKEIERVIGKKLRKQVVQIAEFIEAANIEIVGHPSETEIKSAERLVDYKADARILAGAFAAHANYFVTLDREDFISNKKLANALPFELGTPGDCLKWLREEFVDLP